MSLFFCEISKTRELHSQSYLGHNGVLLGVTQEDGYLDLARAHSGPPVCNLMKNFRGVPNCKKCGKRNRGSSTSSPASIVNDHLLLWLLLRKLDLDLKQGITIHSGSYYKEMRCNSWNNKQHLKALDKIQWKCKNMFADLKK